MSCDKFEKYSLGKIREETFRSHLGKCPDCAEKARQDAELLSLAQSLKKPMAVPYLWTRIERSLQEEQVRSRQKCFGQVFRRPWILYPVSAVFCLVLLVGLFLLFRPGIKESGLLADSALRRVERRETRYERSIEKLEAGVLPQFSDLGLELMFLYRDRLETIDEQITQCKEALLENPGNAHIRRYMLAAYQDKKGTLREVLRMKTQMIQEENFQ